MLGNSNLRPHSAVASSWSARCGRTLTTSPLQVRSATLFACAEWIATVQVGFSVVTTRVCVFVLVVVAAERAALNERNQVARDRQLMSAEDARAHQIRVDWKLQAIEENARALYGALTTRAAYAGMDYNKRAVRVVLSTCLPMTLTGHGCGREWRPGGILQSR